MESSGDNSLTGAEALVQLLQGFGVQYIFGLCGDTSLPFYDAMQRLDHGITHVLTRDERHAAYMADAYARVSGRVGVCEGPSGGGATYILPGLVEANDSSIPVLAITSDVSVSSLGHYPLTEPGHQVIAYRGKQAEYNGGCQEPAKVTVHSPHVLRNESVVDQVSQGNRHRQHGGSSNE